VDQGAFLFLISWKKGLSYKECYIMTWVPAEKSWNTSKRSICSNRTFKYTNRAVRSYSTMHNKVSSITVHFHSGTSSLLHYNRTLIIVSSNHHVLCTCQCIALLPLTWDYIDIHAGNIVKIWHYFGAKLSPPSNMGQWFCVVKPHLLSMLL